MNVARGPRSLCTREPPTPISANQNTIETFKAVMHDFLQANVGLIHLLSPKVCQKLSAVFLDIGYFNSSMHGSRNWKKS